MKKIKTNIETLFQAITELEGHNFKNDTEYFQKNIIKVQNENNDWINVVGLIRKQDKIRNITFNNGVTIKVADKHKIALDKINCIMCDDLALDMQVQDSNNEQLSVVENKLFDNVEFVYDIEVDSETHLYRTADGVVHHNTELAKALSHFMFNSDDAIIRLDMSEYMEAFNVQKLIGAPPGFVGYEEGGQLTEKVRVKPYSIVLFDEIEKAHPNVTNILLQILDEGKLTDGQGTVVNFKNTIVIMTSNAGTQELSTNKPLGFGSSTMQNELQTQGIINKALGKIFKKETLNRIDEQIIFRQLNKEDILLVAEIHLENFFKQLRKLGYKIKGTTALKEFIAEEGYSEEYGVRPIHRAISTFIQNPLSNAIIKKTIKPGDTVIVDYNKTKKEVVIK